MQENIMVLQKSRGVINDLLLIPKTPKPLSNENIRIYNKTKPNTSNNND